MGYTKNPNAINKVEKFLIMMVNANENLEWETTDPSKLAYYLREGISASGTLNGKLISEDEQLKNFSELKSKFIIKVKANKVIAQLRTESPSAVMSVKKLRSVYLPNVSTLTEVVGAVAKYMVEEGKEQITIPSSDLSEDEFDKVALYLQPKGLKIEINGTELVISGLIKE